MDTITPFIFVFYSFFALAQFIGGFIYGLFIISRVMKGSRNLGLLEMGWFTFGISSIILLFSFSSESQVLSILASLLSFIAFFLLYLHYESRIRSSHNVPALLLLIIFFIISFIMRFFGDGLGLKDNQIRFYREAFSFIFIIYVSLYAYNVTKKTITISNNRGLLLENRALLLMAIGRFLFLIWEITLVINNNNIPEHSFSEYLSEISFYSGAIIVGISVLLFFYILISMPEYTYKIPIPILTFMLFNSSGITVYSKKVKVQGYNIEFEDQLFSGALTAINNLMQETLGIGANMDYFDTGRYKIYFKNLKNNSTTFVAITAGESNLVKNSLTQFNDLIPMNLLDSLDDPMISIEIIESIDTLIKQVFPYVEFNK